MRSLPFNRLPQLKKEAAAVSPGVYEIAQIWRLAAHSMLLSGQENGLLPALGLTSSGYHV